MSRETQIFGALQQPVEQRPSRMLRESWWFDNRLDLRATCPGFLRLGDPVALADPATWGVGVEPGGNRPGTSTCCTYLVNPAFENSNVHVPF